ncbi:MULTISPECIES: hypothetical protein [unclassified Streptomyces]|uniref:hypothetical protein n=1 Tax=unclassified Streptomyces TaxID=2593676 RepID=UPI002E1E062F
MQALPAGQTGHPAGSCHSRPTLLLTAVVSVKLDHPEYLGATHGRLGGAAVHPCVAEAAREHLGTWLEGHPEQAAAVVGRIVRNTRRD